MFWYSAIISINIIIIVIIITFVVIIEYCICLYYCWSFVLWKWLIGRDGSSTIDRLLVVMDQCSSRDTTSWNGIAIFSVTVPNGRNFDIFHLILVTVGIWGLVSGVWCLHIGTVDERCASLGPFSSFILPSSTSVRIEWKVQFIAKLYDASNAQIDILIIQLLCRLPLKLCIRRE